MTIRGLGGCSTIFKGLLENAPRACIGVKGFDALMVPKKCSRDLVVIKMRLKVRTEERLRVYIDLPYFPGDTATDPPPPPPPPPSHT